MKSQIGKKFVKVIAGVGISAGLILLGYYELSPKASGAEAYFGYLNHQKGSNITFAEESFMGIVYKGDYDSDPDLDFAIITQERPGQIYIIDDIQNQPYETIWIHRDFDMKIAEILKTIRSEINKLDKGAQNKVTVFGRYSTDPDMTQGKFDGFLELTLIWIDNKDGDRKIIIIKGALGGVR